MAKQPNKPLNKQQKKQQNKNNNNNKKKNNKKKNNKKKGIGAGKLHAKAPSFKKVTKAIKKSAKVAQRMQQEQQAWADEWYNNAKAISADNAVALNDIRDMSLTGAKTDRARLENVFYPLEDEQISEINEFQQRAVDFDAEVAQLKADALAFKSEANQKYMAGKAQANVHQAFTAKTEAAERALADAGVNPSSGASQSLALGARLAEGAAQAAAGTTAADAARQEGDRRYQIALDRQIQAAALAEAGLQAQQAMVNVGRTYPEQILAEQGLAAEVGSRAVDEAVAIGDAATRQRALGLEYGKLELANLQTWRDTIDTKFDNKLARFDANTNRYNAATSRYNAKTNRMSAEAEIEANESSGIGSLLGVGAGILRGFLPGFQEGGLVEEHYADGGGVEDPTVAGGMADSVPARLTPGEFVVPPHVVRWKGEEYFQRLIDKAPKEKQNMVTQTGATPALRAIPAQPGALTI